MKISLVKTEFRCTYDLYRNGSYIGYITPACDYGYQAICHDGEVVYTGPTFGLVLRMVCTYGKG